MINLLEKRGKIIRLDESLMFTKKNFDLLIDRVKLFFKNEELMSVPQFKEIANTSRKYAVPILEYLDKKKITFRDGNNRRLVR